MNVHTSLKVCVCVFVCFSLNFAETDTNLDLHMGELKGRCHQLQCECFCLRLQPLQTPTAEENKAHHHLGFKRQTRDPTYVKVH